MSQGGLSLPQGMQQPQQQSQSQTQPQSQQMRPPQAASGLPQGQAALAARLPPELLSSMTPEQKQAFMQMQMQMQMGGMSMGMGGMPGMMGQKKDEEKK